MIDLSAIRLEQAKYLKGDARQSALTVSGIILYVSVLLLAGQRYELMALWIVSAMSMIVVTLLYARFAAPEGITSNNYQAYLKWHTVITFCTGVVWGINSLLVADYESLYSIFIAVTIATSITVGGMFPGNSYRPAYIALAIPTILLLAAYITITAPLPIRYFGMGLLLYFAFALLSSAKAELATRDWVISKTQQKLADSVVAYNAEVKEVFDSKTRFLTTASHDLSQPLHAQGHYIEALRQTAKSPEQNELIEKIALTWRAQKEMLGDLVDVLRLDGGMIQPRFSTFDIAVILQELANQIALEAKRKDIEIISYLPASLMMCSDPIFLRRIVSNAMTNAINHAAGGHEIELHLERAGGNIYIAVKDRGPGFHVEGNVLTAPIELRRDGVGLTSIENMSKLIAAQPSLSNRTDGAGSIFSLIVPLDHEAGGTELKDVSASSVLVIDDDHNILDAITVMFTQWGVLTLSANSVEDGLSILTSTQMPIDLLIVDNRLANDMDAPKAITTIRAATREDLPAVVVSGDVYAPAKLSSLKGVSILPKPVDARDFRQYFER